MRAMTKRVCCIREVALCQGAYRVRTVTVLMEGMRPSLVHCMAVVMLGEVDPSSN